MRAREFLSETDKTVTINIPITITIPSGDGDPSVSTAADPTDGELPPEPVAVFPLQQELELKKHGEGKRSKVINQIVDDSGAWSEDQESDVTENLNALIDKINRLSKLG